MRVVREREGKCGCSRWDNELALAVCERLRRSAVLTDAKERKRKRRGDDSLRIVIPPP